MLPYGLSPCDLSELLKLETCMGTLSRRFFKILCNMGRDGSFFLKKTVVCT